MGRAESGPEFCVNFGSGRVGEGGPLHLWVELGWVKKLEPRPTLNQRKESGREDEEREDKRHPLFWSRSTALRDDVVHQFVCSLVCSFVCRHQEFHICFLPLLPSNSCLWQ